MFKRTHMCLFALAALSVNVFSYAEGQYNQNTYMNADSAYANTNNSGNTMTDQELGKKIRDKISSGWFSKGYDQVTVNVQNGNVSLQGTVKNADDKEKLDKEVRNMDGVKSLNSQVTVLDASMNNNKAKDTKFAQDTYSSSADDQLNKKIRDKVSRGWLWDSYQDVTLNTTNGIVTLEGAVDSLSDQQKLMTEIQKIDGVKSVKSDLRIKNR